jgi:hypothetical protein
MVLLVLASNRHVDLPIAAAGTDQPLACQSKQLEPLPGGTSLRFVSMKAIDGLKVQAAFWHRVIHSTGQRADVLVTNVSDRTAWRES